MWLLEGRVLASRKACSWYTLINVTTHWRPGRQGFDPLGASSSDQARELHVQRDDSLSSSFQREA